jgi:hypothetical protein
MSPRPALACALLAACVLAAPGQTAPPFRYPEGTQGQAALRYVNGLPVLLVAGTPEEIGTAAGALAVRPGERMLSYPDDLLRHFHVPFLRGAFARAGDEMVRHFPADYRAELEALARGAGVERDRVVVGNTLFDLKKVLACSALLVEPGRSATGGPLLGRNLDYPSLGYAHEYSLVTVCRPAGARHPFASVGFPGLVGCLSGMNDAGLALAVLEVFHVRVDQKKFDPSGLPYALCYRRLLEECATIAEAKELLEQLPRTATTNLVVADREGVAVFEVTPRHVLVRRPEGGTCVCTNHFCTPELRPFVRLDTYRTLDRYEALERAAARHERLGLTEVQEGLDAASQGDHTLQTMVFEPGRLRLHLAVGTCPASAGPFRRLDLGPLFQALGAGSK